MNQIVTALAKQRSVHRCKRFAQFFQQKLYCDTRRSIAPAPVVETYVYLECFHDDILVYNNKPVLEVSVQYPCALNRGHGFKHTLR